MSQVRSPRQKRGIDTKQKIIKTAFKIFAEKGIHGTNSKEIVAKAGVSIGSFYSYFKNKKTLLLEMLEDYVEEHFRVIWQTLGNIGTDKLKRDDLKSIVLGVFKAYEIAPEFHRQTHALRYSDPDIKKIYDREREREIDQILFLMEQNKERLSHIKDYKATALVIHNVFESVAHTTKFLGTEINEESLSDAVSDMISGYLIK